VEAPYKPGRWKNPLPSMAAKSEHIRHSANFQTGHSTKYFGVYYSGLYMENGDINALQKGVDSRDLIDYYPYKPT